MRSNTKWLVFLFGDIHYDGRVQRMIKIAQRFGKVHLVDCSEIPLNSNPSSYSHTRCLVTPNMSQPSKHLKFSRIALSTALTVQPNVVLGEDFYTTMISRIAATITGARFIYDAHELIIPDKNEIISPNLHFWALMERFAISSADLVIAANSERAQIMTQNYHLHRPAIYMRNIPIFVPPSTETLDAVRRKYDPLNRQISDEVLVLYQGALIASRGLQRFIEALAYLPKKYRLIIAGDGPDLKKLLKIGAGECYHGRIDFLGRILNTEVVPVAKLCDIGIVTYNYDTRNTLFCSPNKVFEYAQAGLSVISSDQPPLLKLLEGRQWARLIAPSADAVEIAASILELPIGQSNIDLDFLENNKPSKEHNRVEGAIKEILSEVQ